MKKIHLLCNAHIDYCWQWDIEEGIAAAISTFRCAADFCEEYDALIFNHNESIIYKWVEEFEPHLFKRITKLILQGRWNIIGGWYLQPDCNLPSGESFVRQILLGKQYFTSRFNKFTTTAVNFDSFGHNRGLVQILKKAGYENYIFCRPFEKDMHLQQDDFIWVGYDGSEINGFRTYGLYNSLYGTARKKVEDWIKRFPDKATGCILWGVGDHGGGPSRVDLDMLAQLMEENEQYQIFHSKPEAYFQEVKSLKLNEFRFDKGLNTWGPGCYTSMIKIKQLHRKLENEFYSVERMLSHACISSGLSYPKALMDEALEDLMMMEFHDILPGSAIKPVEETGLRKGYHGLEILNRQKMKAFFALCSGQPKAKDGEIPILAYNPLPYPVPGTFECEFMLANMNVSGTFINPVVFFNDVALPSQCEKEESNFPMDWRKKVVFTAELQPMSVTRFDCKLDELESEISRMGISMTDLANQFLQPDSSKESEYVFEEAPRMPFGKPKPTIVAQGDYIYFSNSKLTVTISTLTGLVESCFVNGRQILSKNSFCPCVFMDTVDSWAAFDLSFTQKIGEFKLVSSERATTLANTTQPVAPIRVVEDGDVRTVIEAVMEYHDSVLLLTYKLPKHSTEIELEVTVNWAEKDRMLKLVIPTAFEENCVCTAQTSYGSEVFCNDGRELFCQQWTSLDDGEYTFSAINEGSYGFSADKNELRLTLLRSPAYAAHPSPAPQILSCMDYRDVPRMDQGERTFRFWFYMDTFEKSKKTLNRIAQSHNEKPFLLSFFPDGNGNAPIPLCQIANNPSVLMTVFKPSECANGWIVRFFEPTGTAQSFQFTVPDLLIDTTLTMKEFEIATYHITHGCIKACSLLEDIDER